MLRLAERQAMYKAGVTLLRLKAAYQKDAEKQMAAKGLWSKQHIMADARHKRIALLMHQVEPILQAAEKESRKEW